MRRYWVSWWAKVEHGPFEIHSPWWFTGFNEDEDHSVCAAIQAKDEDDAMEKVFASYDIRPEHLDFRFVEERPADWTPFSDRFPRRDWMQWPS